MSLNSHRFNNGIKAIVRDMQQQVPDSTEFMPTSYDQKTHRVKGYFIQSGKESAWLSILSPFP